MAFIILLNFKNLKETSIGANKHNQTSYQETQKIDVDKSNLNNKKIKAKSFVIKENINLVKLTENIGLCYLIGFSIGLPFYFTQIVIGKKYLKFVILSIILNKF